MNRLFACWVGLGLCALAPCAFAQNEDVAVPQAPQPRDPSAQPERRWYGWQTLTSDAASVALLIGAIQASGGYGFYESETRLSANVLMTASLAGYVAGAPALHFIHERPAAAAGSIGLRLILPTLGGLIGSGLATCPPPSGEWGNCGLGELVLGVGAGALAAVAIDAGALSWAPIKAEAPAAPRLGFAPVISSDGKRGELRVFGTF
jgi:hypothetical protein